MKIDASLLQAAALAGAATLGALAAADRQWGIVSAALTGFFAVLNIRPKDPPPASSDDARPAP